MIVPPITVRVLVATKPVDFRKGMDGLAAHVQEAFKTDPFSGVIYVFRAKARRSREAAVLGRHRFVPADEAAGRGQVPLAQDRGRRDALVAGTAVGAARGPRLVARARTPCRATHSHAMIHMSSRLQRGRQASKSATVPPWHCRSTTSPMTWRASRL